MLQSNGIRLHAIVRTGFGCTTRVFEPEAGRSALRRIALNIVRLMDDDHSLKGRMHIASMNDKYLLGLLANAVGKF